MGERPALVSRARGRLPGVPPHRPHTNAISRSRYSPPGRLPWQRPMPMRCSEGRGSPGRRERGARRGEADWYGRRRLLKRAFRPMAAATAATILVYEELVRLPFWKKKVCFRSLGSPSRCSRCSVRSPPRSRSTPVGQDSHAPGAPGSSGRRPARPAPSDAFPGCANDPAQGVHAEGWAALPASSGAGCPARWT